MGAFASFKFQCRIRLSSWRFTFQREMLTFQRCVCSMCVWDELGVRREATLEGKRRFNVRSLRFIFVVSTWSHTITHPSLILFFFLFLFFLSLSLSLSLFLSLSSDFQWVLFKSWQQVWEVWVGHYVNKKSSSQVQRTMRGKLCVLATWKRRISQFLRFVWKPEQRMCL